MHIITWQQCEAIPFRALCDIHTVRARQRIVRRGNRIVRVQILVEKVGRLPKMCLAISYTKHASLGEGIQQAQSAVRLRLVTFTDKYESNMKGSVSKYMMWGAIRVCV
jgi:hypothetical protein